MNTNEKLIASAREIAFSTSKTFGHTLLGLQSVLRDLANALEKAECEMMLQQQLIESQAKDVDALRAKLLIEEIRIIERPANSLLVFKTDDDYFSEEQVAHLRAVLNSNEATKGVPVILAENGCSFESLPIEQLEELLKQAREAATCPST